MSLNLITMLPFIDAPDSAYPLAKMAYNQYRVLKEKNKRFSLGCLLEVAEDRAIEDLMVNLSHFAKKKLGDQAIKDDLILTAVVCQCAESANFKLSLSERDICRLLAKMLKCTSNEYLVREGEAYRLAVATIDPTEEDAVVKLPSKAMPLEFVRVLLEDISGGNKHRDFNF